MSAMADTRSRRPRRRFTDEFKQQAVRLVLDEGKSVTAVARELDLVASALGQWVKRAQADRSKGRTALTTAEREELVRLRKALRIAEEERDIGCIVAVGHDVAVAVGGGTGRDHSRHR